MHQFGAFFWSYYHHYHLTVKYMAAQRVACPHAFWKSIPARSPENAPIHTESQQPPEFRYAPTPPATAPTRNFPPRTTRNAASPSGPPTSPDYGAHTRARSPHQPAPAGRPADTAPSSARSCASSSGAIRSPGDRSTGAIPNPAHRPGTNARGVRLTCH